MIKRSCTPRAVVDRGLDIGTIWKQPYDNTWGIEWHWNCAWYVVVCPPAGQGHFGDVLISKAYNIVSDAAETLVMLKSLLSADESRQNEFYRELELFSRCDHDNIVKLLGISRESLPVFAIYEYTDLVSHLFRETTRKILMFHVIHCSVSKTVSVLVLMSECITNYYSCEKPSNSFNIDVRHCQYSVTLWLSDSW